MLKKILVITVASVTLMIAMSMIAFAEGWVQENQKWCYYDANNVKVTDEWHEGADGLMRYLDSQGNMAVNSWVDETYYVDADGLMVKEKWAQLSDGTQSFWYYFLDTGKKAAACWKNIGDNYYHFDDDGHMETGWVLDDMYYCDPSDGHMKTGWANVPDPEDQYEDSDAKSHWYYFSASGKRYKPGDDAAEYTERRIDGKRYCFDQFGAMQTGWIKVNKNYSGIKAYKYFGTDGTVKTGWYSTYPPEEIADEYEYSVEWFYFSSAGVPEASSTSNLYASSIRRINGKSYLFNQFGTPVRGLQKVYLSNGTWTAYYFGTVAQSCVQKGKQTIKEADGTNTTYYFSNNGEGYTGVKDKCLYYKGKLQKADEKYEVIRVNGKSYFVSSSGSITKNKKIKYDGDTYETDAEGCLIKINDRTYTGSGRAPYEPELE